MAKAKEEQPGGGQSSPFAPKNFSPPEFWSTTGALTPEQWTSHEIYIYRLWPKIDRKQVDPNAPAYVEKVMGPIEANHLFRNHGGGDFQLRLNDRNRPRGHQEVGRATIRIEATEHPPIFDVYELVLGHRANESFENRLRADQKHPEQLTAQRRAAPTGGAGTSAIHEAVEKAGAQILTERMLKPPAAPGEAAAVAMLADTHRTSMEMIREQANPAGQAGMMKAIVEAVATLAAGQNKGDSQVVTLLQMMMSQQAQHIAAIEAARLESNKEIALLRAETSIAQARFYETQIKFLEKMMEAQKTAGPPTDSVGILKQMAEAINLVRGIVPAAAGGGGGGGEGGGTTKFDFYSSLVEAIPQALDRAITLIRETRGAPAPGAGFVAGPQAAPALAAGNPAGDVPPPVMDAQEQATITGLGQGMLSAINRDVTGDEFAESLVNIHGAIVYERIFQMGRAGIVAKLQQIPTLWAQLAPIQPRMEMFIADFMSYGEPEPEPEPERAGPTPPAATPGEAGPPPTPISSGSPKARPRGR